MENNIKEEIEKAINKLNNTKDNLQTKILYLIFKELEEFNKSEYIVQNSKEDSEVINRDNEVISLDEDSINDRS